MKSMLLKELRLSMHPTVPLFLLLSSMLLIPNYPYYVVFFYTGLAVFFTCLGGRENNDIFYTMILPVAKRDIVRARFFFVILFEAVQMAVAIPFAILRQKMPIPGNEVGMDANITLFGLSLIMLGIFNFIFFRAYYSDVAKVGKAFGLACVGISVYMIAVETCDHAVSFFRDRLDTKDPLFLKEKLVVLTIGLAAFAVLTFASYRKSVRSFEALDL